jgi:hypothetical protein
MFLLNANSKIIFYSQPINLHKGFDSLMTIIKTDLQIDLALDTYVLFSNVRKDRIKILFFQENNISMLFMRFPRALAFKYQEDIVFDHISFYEFLRKHWSKSSRNLYQIK